MKILAFPVVVICKLLNPVFCFEPCTLNVDVITVSGTDRADGIVEESIYFCSLRFSGCMRLRRLGPVELGSTSVRGEAVQVSHHPGRQ